MYLGMDLKTGEDVQLEIFHTLFTGQTNLSGKTTTIKALIPEALKLGYTILVFDTKEIRREWEGYHDIPLCYQPTTDPLVLIGLLEGIFERRITNYYSTLSRVTSSAKTLEDVISNTEKMEEQSHVGFIKDACHTLADLLARLNRELRGLRLSTKLELKQGVLNVMPINSLSPEAQQLVIKTAFEELLRHHNHKVIAIIDEAFKYLPQKYSSACKRPVQDVVTQGAGTKLFVWLATQFIAPTDKDAMKACAVKILGRQDVKEELEATQEKIPGGSGLFKKQQIMTLQPGQFIYVSLSEPPRMVYVFPPEKRGPPIPSEKRAEAASPVSTPKAEIANLEEMIQNLRDKMQVVSTQLEAVTRTAQQQGEALRKLEERTAAGSAEIRIDNYQMQLEITDHKEPIELSTKNNDGKIAYTVYKILNGKGSLPWEIAKAASETRGWKISMKNFKRDASSLLESGVLIILSDGRYGPPSENYVRIDGEKV